MPAAFDYLILAIKQSSSKTAIALISLSDDGLTDAYVAKHLEIIKQRPVKTFSITCLDLSHNKIADFQTILSLLELCDLSGLKEIRLSHNEIVPEIHNHKLFTLFFLHPLANDSIKL